jgi:hypothetical protein
MPQFILYVSRVSTPLFVVFDKVKTFRMLYLVCYYTSAL